jgi:hypothetical protein
MENLLLESFQNCIASESFGKMNFKAAQPPVHQGNSSG